MVFTIGSVISFIYLSYSPQRLSVLHGDRSEQDFQEARANSEASSARPVKRLNLDPFQDVPDWILATQDLTRAPDISLLV